MRNESITTQTYLQDLANNVEITIEKFKEFELDKSQFCVMPFVNIILEPNGEVGICRHKGTEFTFGNIKDKSIDEIWSSEKIIKWREEHLKGKAKICKTELTDVKCNLCPELNQLLTYADKHNTINPKILRLTANLNGRCNLQCQMCHVWKLPNGFYTEENFWIPARERFFKDILEVDMLSGEPFIQADTFRLIDEISSVNQKCLWTFTTNLHWTLTETIKESLDKIKIKNLIISIDSLKKDVYSKIRYPGNLDFVLSNIANILDYQHERLEKNLTPLNIRIHFLIQKDNWSEISSILSYCFEKKVTPFIAFLYEPTEFGLLDLSYAERIKILDFYFSSLERHELLFIQRVIKPLLRSLDELDYKEYIVKYYEKLKI